MGLIVDTLSDLAALQASDVVVGEKAGVRYGAVYGGYGDSDFYILSGSAASNGLTSDGTVVVQNNDGDVTFVRVRWRDEGKVDCLWWTPALDGVTDSGAALDAFFDTANALAPTQGQVHALIPSVGNPFLTSTELVIGSRVRVTGGGILQAHPSLPQASNLLRVLDLGGTLGAQDNSDIVLDDMTFDGGSRSFNLSTARQSLVRLFSVAHLTVKNCKFRGQESHLLALGGNRFTKVFGNEFSDWGYPEPDEGVDAGSAIIAIANPIDTTPDSELIIENNHIHDGRWNGIQSMGNRVTIANNILRNTQESGIFLRNVNASVPGNTANVGVIANNIIDTVTTAYIDASGIVLGGSNVLCANNIVRETMAAGISIVSEANDVDVCNNKILSCGKDSVTYAAASGIMFRDASTSLSPARVRIHGNDIRDQQVTRTAKHGISCFRVGSTNAVSAVEISGNDLELSSAAASDALYIEPAFVGSGWKVYDNNGALDVTVSPGRFGHASHATSTTLTENDNGRMLTNAGASAIVQFNLPAVRAGLRFGFYVFDADGIRVAATGGAIIRLGASVSSANGNISATGVGSSMWLWSNGANWFVDTVQGTWTLV